MHPDAHSTPSAHSGLVGAIMRGLQASLPRPPVYQEIMLSLAPPVAPEEDGDVPDPGADAAPTAQPDAPAAPATPLMPRPQRSAAAGDTVGLHDGAGPLRHVSTTDLLDLARRLAESGAGPEQLLRELTALGLPIGPLDPATAGVVSVTGNSPKGWNEDTALGFVSHHPLLGPSGPVLMVFDGLGGMKDGRLASKFAALAMALELHRTPDTLTTDLSVHLAAAFERVNRRFRAASKLLYGRVDPGALRSTAIVLLTEPGHFVLGHQGDGQALLRCADGSLLPLLQPHTSAASNRVSRSLGPQPDGEAEVRRHLRQPGDLVALTSDGFEPVPVDQMMTVLHHYGCSMPMQTVAAGLTDECCQQRDGQGTITFDNMSLAVLLTPAVSGDAP
ncbi:protein phosphatase 2C domain-containing protein [Ideonella sp. 4Y16]|uniref:PP2C family protein-serine/threonine phosphatase n=1 Tax=Ideonella alba TaxID=2824118 RepID=UPI001B382F1E|nr:protein phosphatase 2C domain-containing protein [Ideonella alba]MBQ0942254.1 protein phosphatase 2C domain-containing protein [Ideonella alba]